MSSEDKTGKATEGIRTPITRRDFLKTAGVAGLAVGAMGGVGGALAACGSSDGGSSEGEGREIKVGFVAPLTGPLAAFGEADQFCVDQWNAAVKDGLATADGTVHPITIIMKDSQSDSNRAATVAGDLITNDGVDIMMVASTPDTVVPVADQAEALQVPCVSNDCPWQAYYFGRQEDPANPVPFKWTYHFFWGTGEAAAVFIDLWDKLQTNKKIGVMWPNDADGNAWSDPKTGMPAFYGPAGYTFVNPGKYQNGTEDFTAQISKFKASGCQILNGVMIPPDFTNFWKQAYQQGFQPVVATIAKAILFPSALEALGDIGYGLTSEVWWSPNHPFKSSLTGQTCQEVADAYESTTGNQWTQPIMHYAVFEVVADAIKRTENIDDKESILSAIVATQLDTVCGPVSWNGGTNNPVPNVSTTPLVGGQWVKGTKYPFDLAIVGNSIAGDIPTTAELQAMQY